VPLAGRFLRGRRSSVTIEIVVPRSVVVVAAVALLGASAPRTAAAQVNEVMCEHAPVSLGAELAAIERAPEPPMCDIGPSAAPIEAAPIAAPVPEPAVVDVSTTDGPLARAAALAADGRHDGALAILDAFGAAEPLLADRVALARGDVLLAAGRARDACRAYGAAIDSLDAAVDARARVGRVRCLIASDHRDGADALAEIRRRFPRLPDALGLRVELARMRVRTGDARAAAALYRVIDLDEPGSAEAVAARAAIEELRAAGTPVRPFSAAEQIARAERLVASGPMPDARTEVERLYGERLTVEQRASVCLLAARVARIEGRWEDARRLALEARGRMPSALASEDASRERDAVDAAAAREQAVALGRIAVLRGGLPWRRVSTMHLRMIVDLGATAGLSSTVDEALAAFRARREPNAVLSFELAITAAGVGSDEHVEAVLAPLVDHPRLGVQARYHRARALERLGRLAEAEIEHLRVEALDRSENRYYAMWSRQRVRWVHEAMICGCDPEEAERRAATEAAVAEVEGVPPMLASADATQPIVPRRLPPEREGTMSPERVRDPGGDGPDLAALAARIEPVAAARGEAFPWLARSRALLLAGEPAAASDELHEAYLAWREANGRPLRGDGLPAVFRGEQRPSRAINWQMRGPRRRLDAASRTELAEVAAALGDEGTAIGFAGPGRAAARPRAFEAAVNAAARRHNLDPNLLLAVMRVESVYQHRIVSYAGAVGLMQIMPRTGSLIARNMGHEQFGTDDLLDPRTNVEMGAWYLTSLIARFDGHLPLAIAAYNGGPHNVRRWLRGRAEDMPLDAFLETIPFEQTHRYVRRVLTHYQAYRAQQGLPMPR
jgi:soluble lytic murein transglycosylase